MRMLFIKSSMFTGIAIAMPPLDIIIHLLNIFVKLFDEIMSNSSTKIDLISSNNDKPRAESIITDHDTKTTR